MTANEQETRTAQTGAQTQAEAERAANPARFKLLYESADKRFCLFEDHEGHLTSVRSAKLA